MTAPLRISLCMILRDEEELLPRFLRQVEGACDELIAVDTGSIDRTPEILARAGARVLRVPWRDDFAAARNVGIDAARGAWILVLDADEMPSPELVAGIRATALDPAAGAAQLRMRNPLPHGHHRDELLLRFFRSDPRVRYRHAIHETVADGVAASLRASGLRMAQLPGWAEHLGYAPERVAARRKRRRDVAILDRCLRDDPLDLYRQFKRVEQAALEGAPDPWARAAADAERAMEAVPERLAAAPFGGELVALVSEGLHRDDLRAELRLLDRWERRVLPSAALLLRRGVVRERLGLLAAAETDFSRCRTLAGGDDLPQRTTVRPMLGLARLALARGRLPEATALARGALEEAPRDPEALLAAATLARASVGPGALAAFARSHAERHGESAELHAAVGEAALLAGEVGLALGALATAAGQPPAGPAAVLLAQALLAAGDVVAARAVASSLVASSPEAALGVLLCDLVDGRDSALEVDLDPCAAERALRRWITAIRAGGDGSVLGALRAAAPALQPAFAWFPAALG